METSNILARNSHEELLALLDMFYHYGPLPVIIGGWAVFFYNSYLGSVDIDVVGPSSGGLFYNLLENFQIAQGYEKVSLDDLGMRSSYRKPIIDNTRIVGHVHIDACTYEDDSGEFHEDPRLKLPYRLCERPELRSRIRLDGRREAFLPKKALLLLYKLKALRDRSHDLRTKGHLLASQRRGWLEAKRTKDASDLIALLDPEPASYVLRQDLDLSLLKDLVKELQLQSIMESLTTLPAMEDSLRLYRKVDATEVEKWSRPLMDAVS